MGKNWADEHPVQMKAIEIGLGAAFSLVSTCVVSYLTSKIEDHFRKKRLERETEASIKLEEDQDVDAFLDDLTEEILTEKIDLIIAATTKITNKYGPDWRQTPEYVTEYNSYLENAS